VPTPIGKVVAHVLLIIQYVYSLSQDKIGRRTASEQSSASPQLPKHKAVIPPSKQPLKPTQKKFGQQPSSTRLAFKPRNGQSIKPKKDGPLKTNVRF